MAILDHRYEINGLIDTASTALDNMTAITNSCNTWLSYDATEGKWAVVINRAGTAQFAFDDSNIIGPINLTTTDLTAYYNSCEVRFHNLALRDREDYVLLEIPADQRLPNEPDNKLIINAPMVNNQIQAQLLGLIELKQSRLDQVIEFTTDFSYINIEAGTIITVTNPVYGWTDQLFRVLEVSETQDATINITITAQEYNADIYNEDDLFLYMRDTEDGLIELDPLVDVSPITGSTQVFDADTGELDPLLFALPLLLSLLDGINAGEDNEMITGIFEGFFKQSGKNLVDADVYFTTTAVISGSTALSKLTAMSATTLPYLIFEGATSDDRNNKISTSITVPAGYSTLGFEYQTPFCLMDYYALDQDNNIVLLEAAAQPAFFVQVLRGANLLTATVVAESSIDWNSNYGKLVVKNPQANTYWLTFGIIPTLDLNMNWVDRLDDGGSIAPNYIYFGNYRNVGAVSVTFTVSIN